MVLRGFVIARGHAADAIQFAVAGHQRQALAGSAGRKLALTAPIDSIEPPITTGVEQSDFDKLRRLPFVYAFNVVNTAALLCTVNAPLPLYAAELGVSKDGIGLLGGILPFGMIVILMALETLVAFLQAYVFAILTCIYLNDAIHPGH